MLKHDNNFQHDKSSVQFFHISTYLGAQMATASLNSIMLVLYSLEGKHPCPFHFLHFSISFSFFHFPSFTIFISPVLFLAIFKVADIPFPFFPNIYFIQVRRNPMYVMLNRVHRCTKAKKNTVLFFLISRPAL